MLRNNLAAQLGIRYPIVQGAMAWISDAGLAAAVSEAGGLGILTSVVSHIETLRRQIRLIRQYTDRPFGVNVMMHSRDIDQIVQITIEEKVPVVTTGAGSPAAYMQRWLQAGVRVIPVVASVNFARWMEREGAFAVIAEGAESGGHIGETTTLCLVPQVCDAVGIPVIAAGGIADGRGFAAALALGAQGVQLGTRFLAACECTIHPSYKRRLVAAKDTGTVVTGRRFGRPVRSLKTPYAQSLFQQENAGDMSEDAFAVLQQGALLRAVQAGDEETGCFMAGQIAGLITGQQPVAEMIEQMLMQAGDISAHLKRMFS